MISFGEVTAVYERVKKVSTFSSSLRWTIGGSSCSESGLRINFLSAAAVTTSELIVTNATKRKAILDNDDIIVVVVVAVDDG